MTDQQTSQTNITEALRRTIETAYAAHDSHRATYPQHTGDCQDARPSPISLAVTIEQQVLAAEPRSDAYDLLRDIVQHWDAGDIDHDYDALSSAIDSAREYVRANGQLSGAHRHPRSDALTAPDEPSHPEERCQRCSRPNVWSWHAPSPLWNAVMRQPDGSDLYGIVCPPCFAELAGESGVLEGAEVWHFAPEGVDIAALWDDAEGRVWDAALCLWVEREARAASASVPPLLANVGIRGDCISPDYVVPLLDVERLARVLSYACACDHAPQHHGPACSVYRCDCGEYVVTDNARREAARIAAAYAAETPEPSDG